MEVHIPKGSKYADGEACCRNGHTTADASSAAYCRTKPVKVESLYQKINAEIIEWVVCVGRAD